MNEPYSPDDVGLVAAQMLPHSREAEEAVLGAVLITPETYYDVAQFLQAEDFYFQRNQWIWLAFTRLRDRRAPIDYLTVASDLDQQGQLGEIGGAAYLTALINQVPSSLNAEAYGHIIEDHALRRRMLTAANQVARLAYSQETAVDTVIDEAEKAIFSISERRVRNDLQPISTVLSSYYDRVDQLSRRGADLYGVPTGLIDLDRLLGGLQKSDLLIVAGRPGMGKTGFLLSVAKNAALIHKKHVAIFSLEMSNEQLVQRLIAQETGIDTQRLRSGQLNDDEWPRFTHAIEVLGDTHIFLDDTPAISPLQLRTKCRRVHMEYDLDLIIIDYLQLMSGDTRTDNRVQEVSYISRNLKVLARELNVPVLSAAQLSRAVEQRADKKPVLSDLRESGCLTGDTLIQLSNGQRVPIRELVGQQPEVFSLNNHWKLCRAQARKVWLTGNKPVYRLTTRTGRTIRATANHPFRKLNGWTALEDLQVGDRIALPRIYDGFRASKKWDDSRLVLLAHMIGDGCYASHQPVHYTSADRCNLLAVEQAVLTAFGLKVKWAEQKNWSHLYLTANGNKWHPGPVKAWLRELGIDGQRSWQKVIPSEIFELSNQQISLFLRHLWATDGSIYLRKTTHGVAGTIYYATSSLVLVQQVQHLLLRLGIQSKISAVQYKLGKPGWHLHVSGKENQIRFAEQVGAFGPRVAPLNEVVKYLETVQSNPNTDTMPNEVWTTVKAEMHEQGISQRAMAALRGTSYGGDGHFSFSPSRRVLLDYAVKLQAPALQQLAESDVYWDTVETIEPDGVEDVYDMEVPDVHNFIANDIVVHNSLEQDADIVMFINRPDAMEKDSPRQNLAEIIVAKHRNGPTHPGIELVFRNNLARFDNAASPHQVR